MAYQTQENTTKTEKTVRSENNTLSQKQKEQLKAHKMNHTPKHMAMMRKLMKEGMSFTKAHNKTKKEIGM